MELLICQSCGQIIRGRSKTCNGCGTVLSKHSPTVVNNALVGVSALAVPVRNDPLVLERTVNHIIYNRNGGNGNGNGHANGNGNGHEEGAFLYNETDLNNIVFPICEEPRQLSEAETEAAQDQEAAMEPAPQPYAADEQAEPAQAPTAETEAPQWELTATGTRLPMFGGAGTPMAAGAAHALASIGAQASSMAEAPAPSGPEAYETGAQSDVNATSAAGIAAGVAALAGTGIAVAAAANAMLRPVADSAGSWTPPTSEREEDASQSASPTQDFQPAQEADMQTNSGTEIPGSSAAPGDDFFAGPNAKAARSSLPAEPAETAPPVDAYSAAEVDYAARRAAELQTETSVVTPAQTNEFSTPPAAAAPFSAPPPPAPVPAPAVSEPVSEPRPTSAQASSRPGLMDFFATTPSGEPAPTGGGAITPFSPAESPTSQTDSLSPNFMSGAQASIIQNAINAAANLSTSTKMEKLDEPKADFNPMADASPKKSSSKKAKTASKKSMRPSADDDEDEATPAKKTDKSKKGTSKTSLAEKSSSSKSKTAAKKSESKAEEKNIELMGFSLPAKMIKIAAVIVLFVGFPLMVLVANISSIVGPIFAGAGGGANGGGGGGNMSAGAPTGGLSGQWKLAYQNPNGSVGSGVMVLTQNGGKLEGYGNDKSGQFQVRGTVGGGKVEFNKQYVQGNQPQGKPILYAGRIDDMTDRISEKHPYYVHIDGIWQLTKREGFSWRAQIVSLQGKFEAGLERPGEGSGNIQVASGGGGPGVNTATEPKDPKKAHDFFMKVALGIVGLGVALAMLSLKFFGPSGLLNIWAKKEYIPSQFKSQHFKMVEEMGKPLRPGGCPLGTRKEWGLHQFWLPRRLNMPPDLREQNPHTLIIGAGAKGKSRLMASMISNDIESADRAVVVVDSDGALIDLIMSWIAAHPKGKQMAKRVIVIDPTFDGETICYNPLEYPEDGDLQNAASSVVFGFKAIYTEPPGSQSQWNQQTANILRNSAVLLMANGKTLTDLPVLLSDNDFRDILLEKVEKVKHEKSEYTTLIDAWTNYKRLARTDQWINWIEPILNRVQPMLGDPRIRPILTRAKSDLVLTNIIQEKKILFVKIPQGQLDQNGNLLGSLMVTGIKQACLSLSVKGGAKKRPVSMYLDEFDTFIEKETFDAITSETRKFQLGFCGASKSLQTLPEDYRNQLIINVGMMAIFALAKKDGDMLGPQMFRVDGRKVKHQTIQNVFNKVNSSPQFELISDEEKLNIDRVVGQEERTYFCYRVGTVAGVFNMLSPEFKDILEKDINQDIMEQMYTNRLSNDAERAGDNDEDDEEEDEE